MAQTSSAQLSTQIDSLRIPESERHTTGGNSRLLKFLFWLVLGILLVWGVIAWQRNPPWLQELRGADYDTASVIVKGREEVALELSGFVVPYHKVNISPRIPGMLTKLNIEVGQKVKKGDVLAQLDDSSYQADLQQAQAALQAAESRVEEMKSGAQPEELDQARAAVEAAEAKLKLVSGELDRAKQLEDSTTQSELDQLQSAKYDAEISVRTMKQKLQLLEKGPRAERIKAAQSEVTQAKALVAKANYFLDNTRIVAPLDGTVLEKAAEVGEILRPEVLSVSLCTIADLNTMEVEVDVQERDLQRVEIGRPCKIIPDAYSNREYAGKIDRVQPQVNRARGVVRVTIRITEPDSYLLPDMNVRALILNPPSDEPVTETLWISEGAVVREGERTSVFVLNGERARKQEVKLGETEGKRVLVLAGLNKEDVVVLPGGKRVVDGQIIRRKAKK